MIYKIRRLYRTRTVGHAGTLDPLAVGVLPVMVGTAVKLSEYLMQHDKVYTARLRLGVVSDTQDIMGDVKACDAPIPREDEIRAVLEGFVGRQLQIPPMHSAIKVGGRKLYDLARDGIEIERAPRDVEIYSLDAVRREDTLYELRVACSKGTYIRTLCADIGERLGCGGVMEALRRDSCGSFRIEDSLTLEQLEGMSDEQRLGALVPPERCFDWAEVRFDAFYSRLARNGAEIYLAKLGGAMRDASLGERYWLRDCAGVLFAVGEVREYEAGLAVKPVRMLG